KVRLVRKLTDERGFGFLGTPRFGADAAERDASLSNSPTGHADYDCRRSESELIRGAIAQLQIELLAALDRRGKRDMRDEVARFEDRFALRRVAGQQMKVGKRNRPGTFLPLHVNGGFQRRHCD